MTLKQTNNTYKTNRDYRLSIQITLNGLSFLVVSNNGNVEYFNEISFDTPHTPEELLIELESILNSNPTLQDNFKEVTLIYYHATYGLVPAALFDEKKASEYLKFNTKLLANDFVTYDRIEAQDVLVVYIPYVNINNSIFERFGSFKYYHSSSLLLKHLLHKEKHAQDVTVYIHVAKHQFECLIISKGKLQLCNSYKYSTPEDFIYYILFCFEQCHLNPDTVTTILLGDIVESDPNYTILYTYVRNVSFLTLPLPTIPAMDTKEEIPPHSQFLLKTTV